MVYECVTSPLPTPYIGGNGGTGGWVTRLTRGPTGRKRLSQGLNPVLLWSPGSSSPCSAASPKGPGAAIYSPPGRAADEGEAYGAGKVPLPFLTHFPLLTQSAAWGSPVLPAVTVPHPAGVRGMRVRWRRGGPEWDARASESISGREHRGPGGEGCVPPEAGPGNPHRPVNGPRGKGLWRAR